MKRILAMAALVLTGVLVAGVAHAVTVDLPAAKDNTLYEIVGTDTLSNGAGQHIFIGVTDNDDIRRSVLQFDLAGIPPTATINSVTLMLYRSRGKVNTSYDASLHRALADWGEGTSVGAGEEGAGAPATAGDATWANTFYPAGLWTSDGGDYAVTPSATTGVGGNGFYTWTSAGLVSDVQGWLATPATNYGWVLIGDETITRTAKRFESRTNSSTTRRPLLSIDYSIAGGDTLGACCLPSDSCAVLSAAECALQGGTYEGDSTVCTPDPCGGPGPSSTTLTALKDNTLYEDVAGSLSNGLGTKFIAGIPNNPQLIRRGLLAFDLTDSVPSGSVISNATLTMYVVQGGGGNKPTSIHRSLRDWGEGTSVAPGDETAGGAATTGDATWLHTFYPDSLWGSAGGDYDPTPSATTQTNGAAFYTWSGPSVVADVQAWADSSWSNYGWFVLGDEANTKTDREIASVQNPTTAWRPTLQIDFTPPPPAPAGACCFNDGSCDTLTQVQCEAMSGTYQGDGTTCTPNPCPVVLEPFVDALPLPGPATPVTGTIGGVADYLIEIVQFEQQLHRDLPPTTVWGYGGLYPGPTIEASRDKEVTVTWVNNLRDTTGALRTDHILPVDLCMHGPDSAGATPRTVVHLHGGHVEQDSDGYPDDTILPGEQQTFYYPNHQLPATLWYHDHALGITRLNVIMGMAGFYLLRDSIETALGLPSGPYEVPMAIQDRTFNPDGSFQYPAVWEDHFFGDKLLVNGKVWPYLNVDQGKYRFRWLNGSNSRVYRLKLSTGDPFRVIGSEGGLFTTPIWRDSIIITPGERFDVIVDFSGYAPGTEIILKNSAPTLFPGNPGEGVIPDVMKFIVQAQTGHTAAIPDTLRPVEAIPESISVASRDFLLEKETDACAGSIWTINGLHWDDITEQPVLNTTEIWRFINRSGVTHPMHMHLVMFQVLDVAPFTVVNDSIIPGTPVEPDSTQMGWKDTVPVYPNEMVRVIATFDDYLGKFAYHCHILEHEDHEMMRQFEVVPDTTVVGVPQPPKFTLALGQSYPNPARSNIKIDFTIPRAAYTELEVFDVAGKRIVKLVDRLMSPGRKTAIWNGRNHNGDLLASGVYFYRLTVEGLPSLKRSLVVIR